jgi:hypothetical protein
MPRKRLARMIGGGLLSGGAATCPPGTLCMDSGDVLVYILIAVALVAIGVYVAKQYGWLGGMGVGTGAAAAPQQPTVVVVNRSVPPPITLNGDPRFAPLSPERSWGAGPDLRGQPPLPAGLGALPVNTQTRGLPDAFQQVGVLTAAGGTETSATPTRTILPLFGRSIDSGRNRWNYYTRTDGMNPVQVPLQFKRRNCDDDNGCDEIMDGDNVGVPVMGQSYTATLYRFSTPRYLPF